MAAPSLSFLVCSRLPDMEAMTRGKVGVDKSLEKDINLAITLKLKEYLEQSDVKVILTREDDRGLYTEKITAKRRQI